MYDANLILASQAVRKNEIIRISKTLASLLSHMTY